MAVALIALGSNLGDRLAHLNAAVAGMLGLPGTRLVALSPLYETAPVGGPDRQGAYLNAAAHLETALSAPELLAALQRIEWGQNRERNVRWGPRTLDLDILVYEAEIRDGPKLVLPHPRMHERRFVMVPVCDIAAGMVHPGLNDTMLTLLNRLPAEPGDLTLFDGKWTAGDGLPPSQGESGAA